MVNCRFGPGVITKAVGISAKNSTESPYAYILTLMSDWMTYHLHTESDVDEYLMYRDAAAGKMLSFISPEEANEKLREMLEKQKEEPTP